MSSSAPIVSAVGLWPPTPQSPDQLVAWAAAMTQAVSSRAAELARRMNEEILVGTAAQRPAALGTRRWYWATDTLALSFDDSAWRAVGGAGLFILNQTGQQAGANFNIAGSGVLGGTLTERGRSVPIGEWIAITFNAADFTTSGAGGWTVASGNMLEYQYMLIGKTMLLNVGISQSTVTAPVGARLSIKIPGGFTASVSGFFSTAHGSLAFMDNGVAGNGITQVLVSGTRVDLFKDLSGVTNWTASAANTTLSFQVAIPVA